MPRGASAAFEGQERTEASGIVSLRLASRRSASNECERETGNAMNHQTSSPDAHSSLSLPRLSRR